jgi:hypothetical protein
MFLADRSSGRAPRSLILTQYKLLFLAGIVVLKILTRQPRYTYPLTNWLKGQAKPLTLFVAAWIPHVRR